jgi:hypothetical protein
MKQVSRSRLERFKSYQAENIAVFCSGWTNIVSSSFASLCSETTFEARD